MHSILERSLGRPMRSWIFQGNPSDFDIDGYLAAGPNEITWLVRRYVGEIKPGDVAYIWRSSGGAKDKAGIVARTTVLTEPAEISDDPAAVPFWKIDAPTEPSTRVKLRVDGVANSRELIKSLLKNPAYAKMGQPPSPDARSPGAQRLPVLLCVDRGADPGLSSTAADPETGGSGPRSAQSHLL